MTLEQIELFEEWRQVIGYEGFYEISNWGRVRSVAQGQGRRTGRLLNLKKTIDGYYLAALTRNHSTKRCTVHRLVMAAFVGPLPQDKEVDHINGNPSCNHILNLRYVTPKENVQAAIERRGHWHKERMPFTKIPLSTVTEIRRLSLEGMTYKAISDHSGVSQSHVQAIAKNWRRKRG